MISSRFFEYESALFSELSAACRFKVAFGEDVFFPEFGPAETSDSGTRDGCLRVPSEMNNDV